MNRRSLLKMLAGLPFVGRLVHREASGWIPEQRGCTIGTGPGELLVPINFDERHWEWIVQEYGKVAGYSLIGVVLQAGIRPSHYTYALTFIDGTVREFTTDGMRMAERTPENSSLSLYECSPSITFYSPAARLFV